MNKKWKCTIETSLNVEWEQVEKVAEDIDYWFVDIKDVNEKIYKSYTGKSNEKVFENLRTLVEKVGVEKVCVRLPLIPDFNTKEDRDKSQKYLLEDINPYLKVDVFEYIRC